MKRDKLKILLSILETCCTDGGLNKTKIVYRTNINFKIATLYLNMLIKEELIEVKNPGPREKYEITDKGEELLKNLKNIYNRLERYPLEL
jgi:predicted transcriptional regulator